MSATNTDETAHAGDIPGRNGARRQRDSDDPFNFERLVNSAMAYAYGAFGDFVSPPSSAQPQPPHQHHQRPQQPSPASHPPRRSPPPNTHSPRNTQQHQQPSPELQPGIPLDSLIGYSPDTIRSLSTKILKQALKDSHVLLDSIVEKEDLVQHVLRLIVNERIDRGLPVDHLVPTSPNLASETPSPSHVVPDEDACKICMDKRVNSVLLECGHMCACIDCAKKLHECPICRSFIQRVVHTFRA